MGAIPNRLLVFPVVLMLAAVPALCQIDRWSVEVQGSYTYGPDDSPVHTILRAASVRNAIEGKRGVGLEVLQANIHGPTESYEQPSILIAPVFD